MHNVPPKFNKICRLCLSLVGDDSSANLESDEIVKKLSIFNNNKQQPKQSKSKNQLNDDDEQLNKKVKRSNEISVSLSGIGSGSVINNGFSSNDIDFDDDAEVDITKRISQCLSIKVSPFYWQSWLTYVNLIFPHFCEMMTKWSKKIDKCSAKHPFLIRFNGLKNKLRQRHLPSFYTWNFS